MSKTLSTFKTKSETIAALAKLELEMIPEREQLLAKEIFYRDLKWELKNCVFEDDEEE